MVLSGQLLQSIVTGWSKGLPWKVLRAPENWLHPAEAPVVVSALNTACGHHLCVSLSRQADFIFFLAEYDILFQKLRRIQGCVYMCVCACVRMCLGNLSRLTFFLN